MSSNILTLHQNHGSWAIPRLEPNRHMSLETSADLRKIMDDLVKALSFGDHEKEDLVCRKR